VTNPISGEPAVPFKKIPDSYQWLAPINLFCAVLILAGLFLVNGAVLFTESWKMIVVEMVFGTFLVIVGLGVYFVSRTNPVSR